MLKDIIEKALNKQIELEASSSQFYLSMASWTETKGLSGSSSFLYQHSDEERMHMLKLVKFINERGGNAVIPALIQPPKTFKSLTHVFESLLEHELNVTSSINNIVGLCLEEMVCCRTIRRRSSSKNNYRPVEYDRRRQRGIISI